VIDGIDMMEHALHGAIGGRIMRKAIPFAISIAIIAVGAGIASAGTVKEVTKTAMAGPYSITLKVLPAESFSGPDAAMTWDSGAEAVLLNSPLHPNHHMVVFVKRDGKPVEDANVVIRYRQTKPQETNWTTLPVARMHMTGKSMATTHYGNNTTLAPGDYVADVTVDGGKAAVFHFSL
jgi:hypothetical protein